MSLCQKMKKVIFDHFRQKRKTLVKRNVLGTFFRPESQKRDFSTFGSKKVKMCSFFASGALLAPKTPQNGKVAPKAEKRFWAFWVPKTCPERNVYHCFALGAKRILFCVLSFSRCFAFWAQNQFLASKSGPKR